MTDKKQTEKRRRRGTCEKGENKASEGKEETEKTRKRR